VQLAPTLAPPVAQIERAAFLAQVRKLGGEGTVLDDKVDPTTQVSNFQQAMVLGAEAIGVYPLDAATLTPVLNQAKLAGIPVIVEDFTQGGGAPPAGAGPFTSQISYSRDYTAFQYMKYIASVKPGANVGIITLNVPVPGLVYMAQREADWAEKFGLHVVGTEQQGTDDEAGGQQATTALMARYPQMDAVVAYSDVVIEGAAAAAKTAGRPLIAVGTIGDSTAIDAAKKGLLVDFSINAALIGVAFANGLCTLSVNKEAAIAPLIRAEVEGPINQKTAGNFPSAEQQLKALFP
jgi:ABC-type sugar transport system substrate-binding protein